RIALSTSTSAATISTTATLLNVSEFTNETQPLETARVRVESRMLSAPREVYDRTYDIEVARSLLCDDAARLVESVRELAGESARVDADADNKCKVVISKQSKPEAEETKAKLEDAGFEVLATREAPSPSAAKLAIQTSSSAPVNPSVANATRLRF